MIYHLLKKLKKICKRNKGLISEPEPNNTFCILPWKHINIIDNGNVKLCCNWKGYISEDEIPLAVPENSINDIWNSRFMRGVRKAMVIGEKVSGCEACYAVEENGGQSRRLTENSEWEANPENKTFDSIKSESELRNYYEPLMPDHLHLEIGNVCNLKCRMCYSRYSSKIEQDPIHGKWAPKEVEPARWRGNAAIIGPSPVRGVEYTGFYGKWGDSGPNIHEPPRGWTDGNASILLPEPGSRICRIEVTISDAKPASHPLKIIINENVIFDGSLPSGRWLKSFDVSAFYISGKLRIQFICPTFPLPGHPYLSGKPVGVYIETVKCIRVRETVEKSAHFSATHSIIDKREWFEDNNFIFNDLFKNPNGLKKINFFGGEPVYSDKILEVMNYLEKAGAAENIDLYFVTNATKISDEFIRLGPSFKSTEFGVSLDGIGKEYEYIRYPASWDIVSNNIVALKKIRNAKVSVIPTFQIYNALNYTDILRYCDKLNIRISVNILIYPKYLSVLALPEKVRHIAAERLKAYALSDDYDCRRRFKNDALALANHLESVQDQENVDLLRTFMLFTNDLDISRNQDFRNSHAELFELIAQSDFRWSNETFFAENTA